MDSVKTLNYSVFVRSLEDQMAFYAAYHQDARNRATHFVLLAAAVLAYYIMLDLALAAAMLVVFTLLISIAELIAARGTAQAWSWFGALFVGGWILQLVGHLFEGRKPALADNLFQIFVAPIFLAAEVFFWLGWKPELRNRVSSSARKGRAAPSS
jgi:uncharacterized membrane protein YGL010W